MEDLGTPVGIILINFVEQLYSMEKWMTFEAYVREYVSCEGNLFNLIKDCGWHLNVANFPLRITLLSV